MTAETGKSGNARLLLITTTVNAFAVSSVGSLINPYLRSMGNSAGYVGMYFAVSALVQAVASFAGGFLADSFGRRRIWIAGKVLQVASFAVLAAGLRGRGIILAAVLSGLGQIGMGAVLAMQAETAEAGWRATFFGVVQTANLLISAVAPLLGGLVADRYGAPWAFFGAIPALLLVIRLIMRLEEGAAGTARTEGGSSLHPPAGEGAGIGLRRVATRLAAMRNRLALVAQGILHGPHPRSAFALLAYTLVNGISTGAINIGLPLLLRDRFGLGYTGISAVGTVSSLGAASLIVAGARLADRHGRRRLIILAKTLCAATVWLAPLATSAIGLYILIFFATLTGNAANGALLAAKMESIHESSRAAFGGVDTGVDSAGIALGSLVGGLAYSLGQLAPIFIAGSAITTSALVMAFFLEETGASNSPKRQLPAALPAAPED